jgi:hypothetical protein
LHTTCHCFYHHLSSSSLSSSHLGKAAATVTHAHAHSCSHEQVNKQQPSTRTQRSNSTTPPASSLARTSLLSTALHADPRWPMTRPHLAARCRVGHLLRLHRRITSAPPSLPLDAGRLAVRHSAAVRRVLSAGRSDAITPPLLRRPPFTPPTRAVVTMPRFFPKPPLQPTARAPRARPLRRLSQPINRRRRSPLHPAPPQLLHPPFLALQRSHQSCPPPSSVLAQRKVALVDLRLRAAPAQGEPAMSIPIHSSLSPYPWIWKR